MTKNEAAQKKNLGRRVLLALVILVFLAIAAILIWRYSLTYTFNDTAFVINGNRYSKQEVKQLIKYSESLGMPKESAAKMFFEIIKRDMAMQQAGIKVSKQEVDTQLHKVYQKKLWNDDGVKLLAKDAINQKTLDSLGNLPDNEGYLYMFYFSRYLLKGPDYIPTHYNDLNLIKKDREYAKSQANKFIEQLENNNISKSDAVLKIQNDLRLTPSGISGGNKSGKFKGEYYGNIVQTTAPVEQDKNLVYTYSIPLPESVTGYIKKTSLNKGINSLQVGKVLADAAKPSPKDNDYKDAYYFFLDVDRVGSGATQAKYESIFKNLPSKYVGV
jgi:hypothetical protein